ncbi:MAG: alkyl hydroperoxide reductase subunit F [Methylophilus sp.]|nr:alkyl hydroperoxide reductase subunit F [Methylophilus sp.]
MLDAQLKTQLQTYLGMLRQPIRLIASLDESANAKDMRELLQEIAELSDKVTLDESGNDVRKPSFVIAKEGETRGVRFAAIPLGHEFTSLVLALLWTGGHPPKVEDSIIAQIKNLQGDFNFEVYMSLSCHNCPDVVQAVTLMTVFNPNVNATIIDGGLYQDEVNTRNIMAVPATFMNGQMFASGRMLVEEILAKVDTGAVAKEAEKLNAKAPYDVLIVGGGPAGASAAIYAARKGIRTGIVAERFGGQVMDTLGIENFISVKATEGPKLVMALEEHVKSYDVDIMPLQRAASLKKNGLIEVKLESGATLKSKAVIVATGARWRELNVPGEKEYKGKGVAYCPHCDGPLFKGKHVAVIGGGNSGVEAAIDLAGFVGHVTLLQFDPTLKADAVLQNKLKTLSNVTVIVNAQTTEVSGDGQKVNGLNYKDRVSGEVKHIVLEGVFVQIGLLPNTDWLKTSDVTLSKFNEIEVDSHGATSVAGVFAAGDVTTVPYKQIVIAMGEGAKASLGAFDYLIRN